MLGTSLAGKRPTIDDRSISWPTLSGLNPFQGHVVCLHPCGARGGLCVCIPDFLSRLLVRRDPEIVRDGQETSVPLIGGDPGPGRKASKEAASKKNASKEAASMEKASKEADSKNNASREAASKDTASKEAASKEAASVVGFRRPGLPP